MKNPKVLSLLLAGLFIMPSMEQAFSAPLGAHVAAKTTASKTTAPDAVAKDTTVTTKTVAKKAEEKILPLLKKTFLGHRRAPTASCLFSMMRTVLSMIKTPA